MLYAPVASFPTTPSPSVANASSQHTNDSGSARPTPTPSGILVGAAGSRHADPLLASYTSPKLPATLEDTFALPTPLVVCLVRHINRDLDEVATPAPIEQCVRELQQYFTPSVAASQVHGAEAHPQYLPTGRIKVQFGKAMDVYASDGAAVVNLLLYSVDEEHSRPKLLAHIAKTWREELVKTGNLESCLVMLYRKDFAEALTKPSASASTSMALTRSSDRAALEPYFSELRGLHFTPQQMCAYVTSEAPLRVLAKLKIGFGVRAQRLRQAMANYLASKRSLPLDLAQRATTALPPPLASALVSRVASSVLTNVPGSLEAAGRANSALTTPFATPSHQRQSAAYNTGDAGVEAEEGQENLSASVAGAAAAAASPTTQARHNTNKEANGGSSGTMPAAATNSASPATSWSVRRLWRYGYTLCVHYLQFAYVAAARQTFQQLFMEYYNNSDDYALVRRAEVLERLVQERCGTLYAIDARTTLQPPAQAHSAARLRVGPYPAALQQGAQLLEGLLLLVACEVGCALLLRDVRAARTRHDTLVEVVREKLDESSTAVERRLPAGLRHRFLLRCHLTGLCVFWPHYERLFAAPGRQRGEAAKAHSQAEQPHTAVGSNDKEAAEGARQTSDGASSSSSSATANNANNKAAGRSVADTITHHEQHLASHVHTETVNGALAYLVRLGHAAGLLPLQAGHVLRPAQVHHGEMRLRYVTIHAPHTSARNGRRVWHDAMVQGQCAELAELVRRVRESLGQLGQVMGYAELNEQLSVVLNASSSSSSSTSSSSLSPLLLAHHITTSHAENASEADTAAACDRMLRSRPGMLQLQRGLTAIAATAYALAGQHRQAFYLYTSLAGSYIADDARLATRMIAHRLLPYLRSHRWWHLEHFVRRLFVEAVNRRLRQLFDSLPQKSSTTEDTTTTHTNRSNADDGVDPAEVAQVWFAVFAPPKMYDLFEECLLFLIAAAAPAERQRQTGRSASRDTDKANSVQQQNTNGKEEKNKAASQELLPSPSLRKAAGHTRREWWDWMRYVDAHVREVVFHGQLPPHDLTAVLHQPVLCVNKATSAGTSPATAAACTQTSSEATPLRVQLGSTVYLSFRAACPVNLLDTAAMSSRIARDMGVGEPVQHNEQQQEEGTEHVVLLTLESRKDWDDAGEPVHVVQLTARPQDTSYDAESQEMSVRVGFRPCHAGLYRLRCLTIRTGVTTLAFCPPHELSESMSDLHEDAHAPAAMPSSGSKNSNGVATAAEKAEHENNNTINIAGATPPAAAQAERPHTLLSAQPGLQCGRLLLVVPEPRTGVRLRVELPAEEHYFADAPSTFTLHVELDTALLRPGTPTSTTSTTNSAKRAEAAVPGEVRGQAMCTFEPDTGLLALPPSASGHWYTSGGNNNNNNNNNITTTSTAISGNSPRSMLLSATGAQGLESGSFAFQPDPAVVALIHMAPHRSAHSAAAPALALHGTGGLLSPNVAGTSMHFPPALSSPPAAALAATITNIPPAALRPSTAHSATRRSSMPQMGSAEAAAGSRSFHRTHASPHATARHEDATAASLTAGTTLPPASYTMGPVPPMSSRELTRGVLIESASPHWGLEQANTLPASNNSNNNNNNNAIAGGAKLQPAVAAHFAAAMAARSRLLSPQAPLAHSVSSVETRSISPPSGVLEDSNNNNSIVYGAVAGALQPAATYSSFAASARHAGSPPRSATQRPGPATLSPNRTERRTRTATALQQQQQERFMALSSIMPLPSSSAAMYAHHLSSPLLLQQQQQCGAVLRVVVLQLPTASVCCNTPATATISATTPQQQPLSTTREELNKTTTLPHHNNNNNCNTPRPGHTTPARTVIPLDESEALAHLPRPHLTYTTGQDSSSSNNNNNSGSTTSKDEEGHYGLDGLITTSTHGRLGCHFRVLRDKEGQSPLQREEAEKSAIAGSGAHTVTELTLRLPLLPFFVTPVQETTKIGFACVRGHETCTTSTLVRFPFSAAIDTQYTFRHFQSRVYCLVTIRNVLQRTALWLRGAVLRVLDAGPTYDVLRLCTAYQHMLHTPWQPHAVLQLMFELALSPNYESVEAVRDHTVQLQLFYSDWARSYAATPPEDRLVLLPMRMAATEAGSAGLHSQSDTTTTTGTSSSSSSSSPVSEANGAGAEAAFAATSEERVSNAPLTFSHSRLSVNTLSPLTPLQHVTTGGQQQQQQQQQQQEVRPLVPLLGAGNVTSVPSAAPQHTRNATGLSSQTSTSLAQATAALRYNPVVLEKLTRRCNSYLAPEASFRSTHLYLFSAVIYAESPWTTRLGATTNHPSPKSALTSSTNGAALDVNSPHFSRRRSSHSPHSGTSSSSGTAASSHSLVTPSASFIGHAMVDAPSSFDFVAGEPVRFCVRLEPHPANWPEDAAAQEDFFIDLVFDPAQWMVIGKQRERRTLSVMDEVTIHFTAVPLLPTTATHREMAPAPRAAGRPNVNNTMNEVKTTVNVAPETPPCKAPTPPPPRAAAAATASTLQLAGHTVCDEGILATPTVKMYWARRVGPVHAGQEAAGTATQVGAEVRMEVVPFRVSVRVRKPLR